MKFLKTVSSICALIIIFSIPFLLRPYRIQGISMQTTLEPNDVVLVDTVSLGKVAPHRGELLVFRNPHRKMEEGHVEVDIKRVIGLPGETVHVRHDRVVINRACDGTGVSQTPRFVDMYLVDDLCQTTYASSTTIGGGRSRENMNEFDMFLGPHDYFVLGDNRSDSSDSRTFGTVQAENFIGRPIIRILPLTQLSLLISRYMYE